jgi:5-formyltetrahydrofolate cyclo-ligase
VSRVVADEGSRAAKRQLRFRLLASRAGRSSDERRTAAEALCARVLDLPEIESARSVACYVAMPDEPGTDPLLAALSARRCSVLLPVLQPDFDLSWGAYEPGALQPARFGIREPVGEPLGIDAVSTTSVVICPALAGDDEGRRLGRGGGSYDRVLARLPAHVLRVALLYDDEVLSAVPAGDLDEPVHVLVTPTRVVRTTAWSPPSTSD